MDGGRPGEKKAGKHHNHPEYAAMVASMDENVGRILRRLDELNIADNTTVILTSNNGVEWGGWATSRRWACFIWRAW